MAPTRRVFNLNILENYASDLPLQFIDYTKGPVYEHLLRNPPETKFNVIFETVGDIDTNLYTHSEAYSAPGSAFVTVGPQPVGSGKAGQIARLLWTILRPAWLGGVKRKWM